MKMFNAEEFSENSFLDVGDIMQTERLLFKSDKQELWVRLLFTPIGLLGVWGFILCIMRHDIIPAILSGILGIILLSIWFLEGRLFYDTLQRQLIFRGTTTLWCPWRISLVGAEAVYFREVYHAGGFTGGSWVDIGICYQGGRDSWVIRQPLGDPKRVVATIAEATGLPIIKK